MDVFREVSFQWRGQEVTVTPNSALLRRIKARGINTLRVAHECTTVGPDPSELCVALSVFLAEAGIRATDDECYCDLVGTDHAAVISFQLAYVHSVNPSINLGKKPEAPVQSAKSKPTARAKSRT